MNTKVFVTALLSKSLKVTNYLTITNINYTITKVHTLLTTKCCIMYFRRLSSNNF